MKTIISFSLFLICCSNSVYGQISWVKQSEENPATITGNGTAISHDMALNTEGDTYITGTFSGHSSFDQVLFPEDVYNSMFLAKYQDDGVLSWAVRMRGNSNNECYAIATDNSNHVYIAGEYMQTNDLTILDFGNITLEGNGSPSTFLAKADSDGNFIWATRILATPLPGQSHKAVVSDIQLDDAGNIYMLGSVVDSVEIEGVSYNTDNTNRLSMFLAKYSPEGQLTWFKHSHLTAGTGPSFIIPGHMVIGSQGQVFINGEFSVFPPLGDELAWDGNAVDPVLENGQFLAQFTGDGALVWWQSMNTNSSNQFPNELGIDDEDNIYLTLQKIGNFNFSDGQLDGNSYKGHVMLLKYNAAGERQFISDFAHGDVGASSDLWDGSLTIHTLGDGTTFMSGQYASTLSNYIVFGMQDTFPMPVPSTDGPRQFLAAFDSNGNYLDVGFLVDEYPSEVDFPNTPGYYWENTAMFSDGSGKLIMTGKFAGELGLGTEMLSTPEVGTAGGQAFTIKFDPAGLLDLSPVSVKDPQWIDQNVSLYPNPANQWVSININESADASKVQVRLYDLLGQMILQKSFTGSSHQLNISEIQAGLYLCQISIGESSLTKKLYLR